MPWNIGSAQNQHTCRVVAHAVDLNEELGFDTSASFRFTLPSSPSERVNLVDKDDGGFLFTRHGEELFNESGECELECEGQGR